MIAPYISLKLFFWGGGVFVSISDEGSLPEIALSDASKLASTYFSLFYRSVHVLYTEIKHYPIMQKKFRYKSLNVILTYYKYYIIQPSTRKQSIIKTGCHIQFKTVYFKNRIILNIQIKEYDFFSEI